MEGFKILEAMISVALLAVGALGLAELHTMAIGGMYAGGRQSVALDIAQQLADQMQGRGAAAAPNCGGSVGCVTGAGQRTFNAPLSVANGFPCTQYVTTPDPSTNPTVVGAASNATYRVDTLITQHGAASQTGSKVVTVSVCWQDLSGVIQQVQSTRLLVPGV
jgi:Tfp pilus assembly protein PilV